LAALGSCGKKTLYIGRSIDYPAADADIGKSIAAGTRPFCQRLFLHAKDGGGFITG
jgi:hypothetical protein